MAELAAAATEGAAEERTHAESFIGRWLRVRTIAEPAAKKGVGMAVNGEENVLRVIAAARAR